MENRLLNKREMAAYFRVSCRTIERWAARQLLQKVVIGGVVRYRADDREALVQQGTMKVGN